MLKKIFNKSKWLHKYIGLIFIIFLILECISGIILNHPGLFAGINVPSFIVPPQYSIKNWNRSSLVKMVFSENNPSVGYVGGKKGVWKTKDEGKSFKKLKKGFPGSEFYGKVNDLLLIKKKGEESLYAATFGGLLRLDCKTEKWKKIFPLNRNEKILKALNVKDSLVIFSPSHAYISNLSEPFEFKPALLHREGGDDVKEISLVKLFFDLHGGKAWGLAGKLIFDFVGLIIIFLSISSFYIWIYPKRWKKKKSNKVEKVRYGFFYKYHLKFGIWSAAILLLIGGTAFFMRPPPLAIIANGTINSGFYPSFYPNNPWDEKIHNALHDKKNGKILIEATDGIWEGSDNLKGKFIKINFPVDIFVMGTTVFCKYDEGGILAGSFNGIYHVSKEGRVKDLLTGKKPKKVSSVRPSETMVSGYFKTPGGSEFITGFNKGLITIKNVHKKRFGFPEELKNDRSISLWNYMFELHNGRIFKDIVGGLYILIIPLGSLLFLLIIITGIYDWLYTRFRKKL